MGAATLVAALMMVIGTIIDYGFPLTNCGPNGSKNGYFTFGVGDIMY